MLTRRRPDILQQPIPLSEPVERVIALTHAPNEPRERVGDILARIAARLIHLPDRDLYRCMVFCLDDAVGRVALAGDVEVDELSCILCVSEFINRLGWAKEDLFWGRESSPLSFSILKVLKVLEV